MHCAAPIAIAAADLICTPARGGSSGDQANGPRCHSLLTSAAYLMQSKGIDE